MTSNANPAADAAQATRRELATEVLRAFGRLRFAATGWSMLPSLLPQDTLVVERIGEHPVGVGDVVLVRRSHGLRAHRVVGKSGDMERPQWITQGDGMAAPDLPVNPHELLGRVTHLIRRGKCIPVPMRLAGIDRLIAKALRRSAPAARAFVYLHGLRRSSQEQS
jgi:hypothetical protein